MTSIKCFVANPTTRVKRFLRRYEDGQCSGKYSYHNVQKFLDEIEVPIPIETYEDDERMISGQPDYGLKSEFPTLCECGFAFSESGAYQLTTERLYQNEETGECYELAELPPGAIYLADWMLHSGSDVFRGPDGHSLIVILPNRHPWTIDGPANNCTMPGDTTHKCWIRHGMVPLITVDKVGHTCAAGGGSIQSGNYHGFLRNGYLEEC
jgi:hypothetical protein